MLKKNTKYIYLHFTNNCRKIVFFFPQPIFFSLLHRKETLETPSSSSPRSFPFLCKKRTLQMDSICICQPLQGNPHEYVGCLVPALVLGCRTYRDTQVLGWLCLGVFFSLLLSPPPAFSSPPGLSGRILSSQMGSFEKTKWEKHIFI